MRNKATYTLDEYNMITTGDSVCVALSGGADSVALFHYFCTNADILGLKSVMACHLNHKLRGEESERDEKFVRKLCLQYKVNLICESMDVEALSEETGQSIEEAAREARYGLFCRIHEEIGCKIATAHTLSDSMETTVFHLTRGTGTKGLMGIPPVRDYIIRPLIRCSRKDIEEYCAANELEFVTDSTNLTDMYTRNCIRHHVMEHLYRMNPGVENAFLRLYRQISAQEDYLQKQTQIAYENVYNGQQYNRNVYLSLHEAIALRILIQMMESYGIEPGNAKLQLLHSYIQSGTGAVQLNNKWYLRVNAQYFMLTDEIEKPREATEFEEAIPPMVPDEPFFATLPTGRKVEIYLKQCEQNKNFEQSIGKPLKKLLDYDKIDGIVFVRQKRDGDKIALSKRGCSKSLKKLFNEMKISPQKRQTQIVLCDSKGVIWVEGAGCSQRVETDSHTTKFLVIDLGDENESGHERDSDYKSRITG